MDLFRELMNRMGLSPTMLEFFRFQMEKPKNWRELFEERQSNPVTIRRDSEYCMFLDVMQTFGIKHTTSHQLPKEKWQDILTAEGYNLTSFATFGLIIDHVMFVFSTGSPHWTISPSGDERGIHEHEHGPEAAFLFAYDNQKSEVIHRYHFDASGKAMSSSIGVEAMAKQYGFYPVPKDTATQDDIVKYELYINGEELDKLVEETVEQPVEEDAMTINILPNLTAEKSNEALKAMDKKDTLEHQAFMVLKTLHEQFSLRDLIKLGQQRGYFGPEVFSQLYGRPDDGLPEANNLTIPQILDGVRDAQETFLRSLAGQ